MFWRKKEFPVLHGSMGYNPAQNPFADMRSYLLDQGFRPVVDGFNRLSYTSVRAAVVDVERDISIFKIHVAIAYTDSKFVKGLSERFPNLHLE